MKYLKIELEVKVVLDEDHVHERSASRMTVLADTYDDALQALVDYRAGKIDAKDIPKTGIDVRKNKNGLGPG